MIEELYKKYYEELINWCHSMTGNLYTAEELVHEAFLRAMLHEDTLSTLKEQQSRSWLYRTVKNLYVDRLRHGKKEIISDEFSQLQIDSEELVRLEWEKLLETLPDLEGVIFSLRYLEGYNSKQLRYPFAFTRNSPIQTFFCTSTFKKNFRREQICLIRKTMY